MRTLFVIIHLSILVLPPVSLAEVQTFTAAHTYILGDHDSKDDARQRCLLEAKRKVLEQAGVYIESVSEVKNSDLMNDKIISFAAAVMQVKETKEAVGFEQGHMTLTLTITAQADLEEIRKQLATRQVDAGVLGDVAAQKERLKRIEAQLEALMQGQRGSQSSQKPASPSINISATDLQKWHAQAAQGHASDQAFLGILYQTGVGVPQDYTEAAKWYEQAAIQGDVHAQALLGMLYYEGQGVSQDYGKARRWYEKAAAQGYAWAQYALGLLYDEGQGVSQDYEKARQWYEKAAAQRDAEAQTNLGLLYERGKGVLKDYAIARQWYEQAAIQGDAAGQNNLGRLYFFGLGVPQDYVQANKWFEKAAVQEVVQSQSYLGNQYFFGKGVPKNYTTAHQWFEKAAAQGDVAAQTFLGLLYLSGLSVPQNYVKAHMWFNVAAANSTNDMQKNLAANHRDKTAHLMPPAQVTEAQRLSEKCQAQKFKGC